MPLHPAVAALAGLGVGTVLNVYADRLAQGRATAMSSSPRRTRWSILLVLCAALFAYLQWMFGWSSAFLVQGTYCSLLLLIAVIDLEHRIVPNVLVATGMLLALCFGVLYPTIGMASLLGGALIGGGIFGFLAWARRGALGMGDVKLATLIGMMTGFPDVLQALTVGVVLGGLAAAVALVTRLRTGKQYMPYAPYLVAGGLLTLLHGPGIAYWYGRLTGIGG